MSEPSDCVLKAFPAETTHDEDASADCIVTSVPRRETGQNPAGEIWRCDFVEKPSGDSKDNCECPLPKQIQQSPGQISRESWGPIAESELSFSSILLTAEADPRRAGSDHHRLTSALTRELGHCRFSQRTSSVAAARSERSNGQSGSPHAGGAGGSAPSNNPPAEQRQELNQPELVEGFSGCCSSRLARWESRISLR
jgi:hypothetical protein